MPDDSDTALRHHLAWLGTENCSCSHEWRASLGTLYGIGIGPGWVRTTTDPSCPYHTTSTPERR